MQYSDEEFYGNVQNTIDEQGQVKPIKEPEQEVKVNMTKTVISTFLTTLLVVISVITYFLAVCIAIYPQTAVKVYEVIGAKDAIVVCYEKMYHKSNSLSDLYNLVQRTIEADDYDKTNKYIVDLQGKSEYQEFCKKVNDSTMQVSEKKYFAYIGDLDSYLISQNILALYEDGKKDEAKTLALNDLKNANIYSFGLSTYADCLASDTSLTINQRSEKLKNLINAQFESKGVLNYIEERLALVDNFQNVPTAENILKVYTALKINNVKLNFYTQNGEESNADSVRLEIEELRDIYESLIS